MKIVTVVGVDPGLVHTGLVCFIFSPESSVLNVKHELVQGLDSSAAAEAVTDMIKPASLSTTNVFIEQYRARSAFSTDERMVQANVSFKNALGPSAKLQPNTGVKKLVSPDLLQMLHAFDFNVRTHHQDLRSAARIAVLGMMLSPMLNRVLYNFVTDNLDGRYWHVRAN